MTGIYKIESIIRSNKIYIGSAIDISKRKREHLFQLENGTHHNPKLQAHYNKYGKDDLRFSAILECDENNLLIHEQWFIDSLNPWFNICFIAGNNLGVKRSPEACKNIGKAKIGHIPWNKGIKTGVKIPTAFKKGSIPWNKGLKGFGKGKKMTAEQNRKNSLSKMGNKNPMFGKKHSQESNNKRSESLKKAWSKRKEVIYG